MLENGDVYDGYFKNNLKESTVFQFQFRLKSGLNNAKGKYPNKVGILVISRKLEAIVSIGLILSRLALALKDFKCLPE